MAMTLLNIEKSMDDIVNLAQLMKDKKALIGEREEVLARLSLGIGRLTVGLGDTSKPGTNLMLMHMNQHIIDALDVKSEFFVEAVYDSAISNIESEIERISENVMHSLIKAHN